MRHALLEVEGGRKERMKIAVIGIGQSLRGDDAAGLEAVRQWQEKYPKTAKPPRGPRGGERVARPGADRSSP